MLRKMAYLGTLLLSCMACFALGSYLTVDKAALERQAEEFKALQAKLAEYSQCEKSSDVIWDEARRTEVLSARMITLGRLVDADRLGMSLEIVIRDQGSDFRKAYSAAQPLLSASNDQNAKTLWRQATELRETIDWRYPPK